MIMIFLFFCIILSTAIQSVSTKLYSRDGGSSVVFNGIKSIFAFIPLAILSLGNFSPNTETVLIGILYGATLCISMYSGYTASCRGLRNPYKPYCIVFRGNTDTVRHLLLRRISDNV